MAAPALHTVDLAIGYRYKKTQQVVARHLALHLPAGRLTCLMGPNGIGKSTLMKTLAGMLAPLDGQIWLQDRPLANLSAKERARLMALVLTGKPATGLMSVEDLVRLGRYPYTNWQNNFSAADHQAVDRALAQVGLQAQRHTLLSHLSDGNLQKAVIARALAQETPLIILDEPTIHLDINNKQVITGLLQQLCLQQGKSILLATHDLDLALTFGHYLWLFDKEGIHQGLTEDLVLDGSVEKVFALHSHQPQDNLPPLNITGDKHAVGLLKKALGKHAIDPQKLPEAVHISRQGEALHITCQDHTYGSIAAFLESVQ